MLWGDYTEPQPLIKEVHNLEHGGVIIQYGNKVPKSDIQKINDFWQTDPNAMLVAPLPKLGNKIALTSWTQWAECTHFEQNAFSKFKSAFRYHAPESGSSRRARSSPANEARALQRLSLIHPCRGGGTGRRARLKTGCPFGTWGFDSLPGILLTSEI